MVSDENERRLPPPRDGVSAVRFSGDGQSLLISSWDAELRLHDVQSSALRRSWKQRAPILDCDFDGEGRALSAGLDYTVRCHELERESDRALGQHDSAVRCVRFCAAANAVVSGSWDHSIKIWDSRAAEACVGAYAQPDKVYSLCTGPSRTGGAATLPPLVLIATAGRHLNVVDLRRPGEPLQKRESALKSQTRVVAMMPSQKGYALGSVEGRAAIEYLNTSAEAQAQRYAFKCHRVTSDGEEVAHAVNAIAFHNSQGTFATGGGDGLVNIWDGENKKRICQYKRYPTTISALAFAPDGETLAVAASYTYEKGEAEQAPEHHIFLRRVAESDVKPKPRTAKKV